MLAARVPKLRQAVRAMKKAGHPYVIVDGTLIPVDRVAADRPFYSGKHKKHGMNLQVIASPAGDVLWVSGALPGSVHDKKAEWVWGMLDELEKAGLVTLAIGNDDGTVRVFNLNVGYAINRICTMTSLTRQQWRLYLPQLPYKPPCQEYTATPRHT